MQTPAKLLLCAGILMGISAILMVVCARHMFAALLAAAAVCLLFAAQHFGITDDWKQKTDKEAAGHAE